MSDSSESGSTTANPPSSASAGTAPGRSRSKISAKTRRASEAGPGSATLADPSVAAALWKACAKDQFARLLPERELVRRLTENCRTANRRLRFLELALEATRWAPCAERLPPSGATVVGRDQDGALWLAMHDGQGWNCMERGGFDGARIVHWCPIALLEPNMRIKP
jgi:hypothetical protein